MHTALVTKASSSALPLFTLEAPQFHKPADTAAPAVGSVHSYAKDEEIFAEGDRAGFVYKVLSGVVRTSKLLSDGRRQIDAFHLAGDIFGIEAGDEYRFCAEAVGDCVVIAYRRSNLAVLMGNDTQLAQDMTMGMMRSLVRAQNHMLLLGRKSALEKIATFLLDMAERISDSDSLDLPMSRTDIADHLGLTIETVSRSFTQLERQGVIELPSARHVVLSNKAALERLNA
ncbi:CRP/FNR family nitrogen fixation transcriptional regulator [Microvirga flocculans]|uniref:CRP/FNR family nitrogen fixation transcriptional regulator n=1 Tax=Microvirga flocculans TaxID=217168 RepID=A0A7W6IIP8_9HYPH|nr:helix-turn-helix domain-containing protein [Microvirga flocculans]MBB4042214.1 CRP/FNR family nitrogen fixation transcriptional regulator [Microvirga flocculans]